MISSVFVNLVRLRETILLAEALGHDALDSSGVLPDSSVPRNFLKLTTLATHFQPSRRVTRKDKVTIFDGNMAGKAGVLYCYVARLAVVKLSVPPAAGRGVFS